MSLGFAINLEWDGSSLFTPTAKRSNASGALTLASGQAITIPWVGNSHTGTAGTTSTNLKVALEAGIAAVLNSYAASQTFS